jgi:hypothetical protein
MPACIIEGCPNPVPGRYLCAPHWKVLPPKLRRLWGDETDYADIPPAADLTATIRAVCAPETT